MHDDDDLNLDEEFPLGDGTASNTAEVACPHCGEFVTVTVDPGGGTDQRYIEDCEVCCNPWEVWVHFTGGEPSVIVKALDE